MASIPQYNTDKKEDEVEILGSKEDEINELLKLGIK